MTRLGKLVSSIPALSVEEYNSIKEICNDNVLFGELENRLNISISRNDRGSIIFALKVYASAVFFGERKRALEDRSSQDIVKALDRLLGLIDEQRTFAASDPRRQGYEYFVQYSQRGYSIAECKYCDDFYFGRYHGPIDPGLCRDIFETFYDELDGAHSSLGDRQGWLEKLLRDIRDKLAVRPLDGTKRGPKGKSRYRDYVLMELAEVFERSGGTIKAYKDPIAGGIKGDFVEFLMAIADACPPALRKHLGTGIGDAAIRWIGQGRPEPMEGIGRIPFG